MENLQYEERLIKWGLVALGKRRIRGDLIMIYKVLHKIELINWYVGPMLSQNQYAKRENLGNNLSLVRESFSARQINDFGQFVSRRHNFLTNRVCEHWNRLPDNVVN